MEGVKEKEKDEGDEIKNVKIVIDIGKVNPESIGYTGDVVGVDGMLSVSWWEGRAGESEVR